MKVKTLLVLKVVVCKGFFFLKQWSFSPQANEEAYTVHTVFPYMINAVALKSSGSF